MFFWNTQIFGILNLENLGLLTMQENEEVSMNYIEIFDKIAQTTSNKEKEEIVKANQDNDEFRALLHAALDPYRLFQFNKVPCKFNKDSAKLAEPFKIYRDLLWKLEHRKITGNNAKDEVIQVLNQCKIEHFRLFAKILIKGSIGIGIKGANKALGKSFIKEFSVMLAPNELAVLTDLKYPTYVQPKLDGYRCVYIPDKGEVQLWSRKGKPFGNKNLSHYFEELKMAGNWVLDGELYSHELDFDALGAVLRNGTASLPKDLKFVVYDCLDTEEWRLQRCKTPYCDRLTLLRGIVNSRVANYKKVIDISNDEVETPMQVKNIYKNWLQKGYEGVMLKDPDGKYQWKRVTANSGEMLKLKPFTTVDLKVTGIYEGEGNFTGTVGGIIADYNGNSIRIGSGFTMADRTEISRNKTKTVGRVAEIKYFEETNDGSLRFPIFIRWRDDK